MKNILFCINSLQIGGAERLLVDKINNFPENFNLHLVLFIKNFDLLTEINKPITVKKFLNNSNIRNIIILRNYFISNKIDVCFSHLEKSNKISLISSVFLKTKSVPIVHNTNIYTKSSLKEKLSILIYNLFANEIIAISKSVRNYLSHSLNINNDKIVLIENGIDFNRIKFNNKTDSNFSIKEFYSLGRLVHAKGYDIMLKFLSNKTLVNKEWNLTIIGDGIEKKPLQNLIAKYNLDKKVSIIGKKEKPFQYIKSGGIALMPSRREGLPIAALEILSVGIPIIASDINPLDIVKDNFNGFRFNIEDENDFKKVFLKILKISKDDYNILSKNSIISVKEYGIEKCVNNYLKLIN